MKKEKLDIIFEDKNIIIVNKKGNLPTIKSDKFNDNLYSKVYDYLHKKNQKVFVVHRLDKDTSGMVIFAKNEKAKNELQNNWEKVNREYVALVHGKTKSKGIIESYLKETKTLFTYSSKNKDGKYARTEYELISQNNIYSLIRIIIKTGRKNQIRVHMSDNRTPIVGDKKYGKKDGYRNMFLIENKISFIHPITKEKLDFEIKIPEEYIKLAR